MASATRHILHPAHSVEPSAGYGCAIAVIMACVMIQTGVVVWWFLFGVPFRVDVQHGWKEDTPSVRSADYRGSDSRGAPAAPAARR